MKHLRKESDCLNCGAEVKGTYCSVCGQANHEPRENFKHILTHFITDYLHLDEKFFSSLKYLLFYPGFLTLNYNAGKRTKYVHPFRLYIFISIVFFLVQSVDNKKKNLIKKEPISIDTVKTTGSKDTVYMENGEIYADQSFEAAEDSTVEQYLLRQDSLPEDQKDNFIKRYINKKDILAKQSGFKISEKINESFKHNIPKMMFLILPVFALILSIFFRKKKLYYVEHFYHSVYLHSFFYLYMLAFAIIEYPLPDAWKNYIGVISIIGLFIYLYKSLTKVYEENPMSTILKIVLSVIFYFFSLMILVVLNAIISFMLL